MTLAACRYTFPLDRLIQDFKYGKKLVLAKPLAHLLVDAYRERQADDFRPDILVAMPLSRSRQIERGFNQAQEIARNLAHTLRLPLINNALVRTADAPKQATLPWRERHKNVRNAFACSSSVAGLHVALIDDVMTSGATASAAAHELRRAGAVNVDIWVVARAVVNTVG
jgi:ComF family protein